MKFHVLLSMCCVCLLSAVSAFGQDRDVRGGRIVIDDNNGNTVTIQTPPGPITGGTLTIPDPAGAGSILISNPSGGSQSVAGDMLPGAANVYDLGSAAMPWQDIFVAGDATAGGDVRMVETGGGVDYVGFQAPASVATSQVWTLPAVDGTSGQALVTDGAGALSWATAGGLSTVTHNSTLSGNGTVGSPLGINLGNANTWTANQTFGGTFLFTSNARIALLNSDNNARDIRWQEPSGSGTQYVGLRPPGLTRSHNYVFPSTMGSAGQVLTLATVSGDASSDSATLSWTTVSSGSVSTNSTLTGDGSGSSPLGINLANSNTWTGNQSLGSGADVRFVETGGGTDYVAFQAPPSIGTNVTLTLPPDDGTNNQVLTTDGAGVLSWTTPSGGNPVMTSQSVAVTSGAQGTITATGSFIRFTGATGAFTIDGFTGGVDGEILVVYNATTQNMTLKFNTAITASNGINTLNGIDASTVGEGGATLIYDGTSSRWIVLTVRG